MERLTRLGAGISRRRFVTEQVTQKSQAGANLIEGDDAHGARVATKQLKGLGLVRLIGRWQPSCDDEGRFVAPG